MFLGLIIHLRFFFAVEIIHGLQLVRVVSVVQFEEYDFTDSLNIF